MEFVFVLSKYDEATFKAQVSNALEKRTELIARKEHPKMWAYTDKMNAKPKAAKDVLEKRRGRHKLYGILLLFFGLFLFIPGLTAPKELLVPLIAGAFSIGTGIAYLCCGRTHKKVKLTVFDQAATKLFHEYETISTVEVRFTDEKIWFNVTDSVDYWGIDAIFLTENLVIFIWHERIFVLQKKDLQSNTAEAFIRFITEKSQNAFEVIPLI